ncbi:MAG: hypothetical protein JSW20_00240 [Nitrospiraceae bacterium]|nr:MAG: hypothetical protein JSW20_00240 [Nitrospiraceae bacterium]
MKQLSYLTIVSLFLLSLLMGCASFPQVNSGVFGVETDDVEVKVAFGDHDRRLIHDYYKKNKKIKKRKGMPPGLAKKEKLPPGLQKQLKKNGKLPPGLAKRNLPHELEDRLSPVPQGYVRLKVGMDIVLMNEETEVIVDIIYDIG